MNYFLSINGQVIGPMSASQVMAYDVNPNIAVSADGVNWNPLYTYPELMQEYDRVRGHHGGSHSGYNQRREETDSKRILCGIMAIIFGTLGVQYFILGKVGGGFLTILLSIITCGAWEILTFAQGIYMLCLSDSEFRRKYVDSTSVLPLF